MTFSLVGMCKRTGMFGAAVTTSSIGVGSRCQYARPGVGAVLTQHRTDPTLGPKGLDLLQSGLSAEQTVAQLRKGNDTIGWRQLAVIDAKGRTAAFHGKHIVSVHADAKGKSSCAIGNIIRNDKIPKKMVDAFESAPAEHLAERLLRGLEAGLQAGGEFKQIKSAALLVVHEQPFPLVDLRVEFDRAPLEELRFLWEIYRGQMDQYVVRAVDPYSIPYPET
ncbi:MAG: DUF1028 domain-containing protein [Proteobacteria bacterium]|nr:DUF1028 domain-containing protein [Pseudomonadota bacterium]